MSFNTPSDYALVVQGGGQKGSFAAGVIDQFMKYQFNPFSLYIGTSAGALNISPFVTGQTGFGLNFVWNYTTKKRFFDLKKFIKRQQYMDLDWAFDAMMAGSNKLDIPSGQNMLGQRTALACLTEAESLKDHYYPIFTDNWFNVLKATCAIPLLYHKNIEIDGKVWLDGAISACTPIMKAYEKGYKRIVVIQTSPLDDEAQQRNHKQVLKSKMLLQQSLKTLDCHQLYHGRKKQAKQLRDRLKVIVDDRLKTLEAGEPLSNTDALEDKNWGNYLEDTLHLITVQTKRFGLDPSSTKTLELLVTHYENQGKIDRFLQSPPGDCFIYRIAPKRRLGCKTLMSKKGDILADYSHGKLCGAQFLAKYIPQVYA